MMVWWRFKGDKEWRFGYQTTVSGEYNLVRMGHWNGNTRTGPVVSLSEIETRPYN